jgi:Concanavalin A-like lectin/glucanases superfamily
LAASAGLGQSRYVNDVLALNPLGYWRLNGNANDVSSHGNNGTLMNGLTFTGPGLGAPVGDPNGQAAVLNNSVDQYISIPGTTSGNLFALDWFRPFSMMIWVKTGYTSSDMIALAKEENSGNYRGPYITISNGDGGVTPKGAGRFVLILQATPTSQGTNGNFLGVQSLTSVNDGNWHFLVATYDGSGQASGARLYIDGSAAQTALYGNGNTLNGLTTLNNVPVAIGSRDGGGVPYSGLLSEAAIFGAALTAAQVRQLQNDAGGAASTSTLPHFAVGGSFVTGFSVVNIGSQPASFSLTFRDDGGNPVSLLFTGIGTLAQLSDTIVANGAKYYEAGTPQAVLMSGSVVVSADPTIFIQALFRRLGSDNSYYEVAVPSTTGLNEFEIPFDATTLAANGNQIFTGMAIANVDPLNAANVVCTARDALGNTISNAVTVPGLNPLGHWANYLFPALTGQRGTLDCSSNTKIGAVGIRALGGNALSSLPIIPIR